MDFLKLEILKINMMIVLNFNEKKIFRQRCLKNVIQMYYIYIIS